MVQNSVQSQFQCKGRRKMPPLAGRSGKKCVASSICYRSYQAARRHPTGTRKIQKMHFNSRSASVSGESVPKTAPNAAGLSLLAPQFLCLPHMDQAFGLFAAFAAPVMVIRGGSEIVNKTLSGAGSQTPLWGCVWFIAPVEISIQGNRFCKASWDRRK